MTTTSPSLAARLRLPIGLLLALCLCEGAQAARITLAVASNFQQPMRELAAAFEALSGDEVVLSFGATGKHYAQIRHGAPFDAFFAADAEHPARLQREGAAIEGSRFTYARGTLALWSPHGADAEALLRSGRFGRLAIANPRFAPYGKAATATLEALGLWQAAQPKLVRGENITQTYQFVASGNAELGFVALSQLRDPQRRPGGSVWPVPPGLHPPLDQQAVLLRELPAARAFLDFARGPAAAEIIRRYGYELP